MINLYIIDPSLPMPLPKALLVSAVGIIVVLAELALIAACIKMLSAVFKKAFGKKAQTPSEEPAAEPLSVQTAPALPETESQGKIDLIDVDEPTAATIMAIVSNKTGIPLNRLSFKSIRLVGEEEK